MIEERLEAPQADRDPGHKTRGISGIRSSRWAQATALVLILGVVTGLPVLLAIVTGSLAIPHNDAWSHSKIAEDFARTGETRLVGWNRTALVGQVIPLGQFGNSIVTQQLFVAGLALVALAATYAYLFPRVGPASALLGILIVGFTPEFGLLATSYMSDVPAFAALMVCLVFTDQALRTKKSVYLAAALVAGVWGFTIREQDLVGPLVAVAVTALAWRGRQRVLAIGLGLASAAAILVFESWRRSLPHGDPPRFRLDIQGTAGTVILAVFSLGLYLAPAVFFVARPSRWTVRTRWACAMVFILVVAVAAKLFPLVFLGNYLTPSGAYSDAGVGTRVSVIPLWLWLVLVILACLSLSLLVGVLLDRSAPSDRTSRFLGALLIAGTIGQTMIGQDVFARYLLPLLPIACAVILKRGRSATWTFSLAPPAVLAVVSLGVTAIVSLGVTANALAFDAARWHAASMLTERGVSATDINAGLEWVGYHAIGPAERGLVRRKAASWYTKMFKDSRECYVISASPLKGRRLSETYDYATYAVFGDSKLLIYRQTPCR